MMNRICRAARREDGAAAVEFAIIAGVLAMLIFGMLQFGLAFFEVQNLRAATREGARISAVGATPTQVRQRVAQASYNAVNPDATIAVQPCPASPGLNSTTVVSIDLGNPALPARLRDIMTLDIPFMPPITLRPTVRGEFRCERGPTA
jgi:Flp pilus assembly protein TadG